jgi:hypothetical protein
MKACNLVMSLLAVMAACSSQQAPDGSAMPDAAPVSPAADAASIPVGASLSGVVRRSAQPSGDAMGSVYVALFDQDPVANKDTAMVVGNALIADADLSGSSAMVAYSISNVAPRADDYYVIAFLDDNGDVDPTNPNAAGPDKGDLVSLQGVSAPKVKLGEAGPHMLDLDLNLVMPF